MPEVVLPATPAVVPTVLPLVPVTPVAAVLALRMLRLEEERWRLDGARSLDPDMPALVFASTASAKPVEVEEVVEATDAVRWRKSESSRFSWFT